MLKLAFFFSFLFMTHSPPPIPYFSLVSICFSCPDFAISFVQACRTSNAFVMRCLTPPLVPILTPPKLVYLLHKKRSQSSFSLTMVRPHCLPHPNFFFDGLRHLNLSLDGTLDHFFRSPLKFSRREIRPPTLCSPSLLPLFYIALVIWSLLSPKCSFSLTILSFGCCRVTPLLPPYPLWS